MSETRKTLAFAAAAVLLVAAAWLTLPRTPVPAALQDRGTPFFPEFTDANAASSLEVIEFDEEMSVARPFKVVNRDGRWTIPSHHNHPADGGNRLASLAATIIGLTKDEVATDNAADHERCGVLDPLDETLPTFKGRGTRITVRGRNDRLLADVIAGNPVEGRPQVRYVRLPGDKRVYVTRADLRVSTKFEDWIERNLLLVEREAIDQVAIRRFSVDTGSGQATPIEMALLRKSDEDRWTLDGAANQPLNTFNINLLITRLVELEIVDVRPKPPGVAAVLAASAPGGAKMLRSELVELGARGFHMTPDGRLLSTEGEVLVHTTSGVFYVLRFGNLATADSPGAASNGAAHRYLFISVSFDPNVTGGTVPADTRARLDLLRARFAPWYYVVSDDSFRKIRLTRKELIQS
jgi:hypothetical protein